MPLHMIKLCVGAEVIDDLRNWQKRLMKTRDYPVHHTRMVPKRADELLDGGSIFWVIKGAILVRQPFRDLRIVDEPGGRKFCELEFERDLIPVEATPKRPFQGWRYLKPDEAPRDLDTKTGGNDLPPGLSLKLKEALVW